MEMKKVTAIVLNYNSFADCEKCLGFLRKQDYPNLSIIVVDNCSTMEGEQKRLEEICEESDYSESQQFWFFRWKQCWLAGSCKMWLRLDACD